MHSLLRHARCWALPPGTTRAASSTTTTLRVGLVPEHFNLPWHIALEEGRFAAVGVNLEIVTTPGGTGDLMAGLRDGSLDVAVSLTEGTLKTCALEPDALKIVGCFTMSPLPWGIHTGAQQTEVQTVADLQTRRFAISRPDSGSHLMAVVLAEEQGWAAQRAAWAASSGGGAAASPADGAAEAGDGTKATKAQPFLEVGHLPGALTALSEGCGGHGGNGDMASGFLWEKTTTQPHVDSGVLRRLGVVYTPWPAFVVSASAATLRHAPQALAAALSTVGDVATELKADKGRTVALARARHGLSDEAANEWIEQVVWASPIASRPDAALERCGATLASLGMLPEAPAVDAVFAELPPPPPASGAGAGGGAAAGAPSSSPPAPPPSERREERHDSLAASRATTQARAWMVEG